MIYNKRRGFTLIEVLVSFSIIALLSVLVLVAINRIKIKERDIQRLTDMRMLMVTLEKYYEDNGAYPESDYQGCWTWDTPGDGDFIHDLTVQEYLRRDLSDPTINNNCGNYFYYFYDAGTDGCEAARGRFYVLGVENMEATNWPHPQSPGWSCADRDWQDEFDWVVGGFEY